MKEGIRVWRRDQGTVDLALCFLKFLMFREACNVARKKKDVKRAEGNSNKDEIKRSFKERLHAISFNLLPTPSASFFFTSAFIPSPFSPVGPRVLLRSQSLTWFIDAACDFYKQRQGADREETFFVVVLAARPVGGHICQDCCSSFNLQILCLSGKMKMPFSSYR